MTISPSKHTVSQIQINNSVIICCGSGLFVTKRVMNLNHENFVIKQIDYNPAVTVNYNGKLITDFCG